MPIIDDALTARTGSPNAYRPPAATTPQTGRVVQGTPIRAATSATSWLGGAATPAAAPAAAAPAQVATQIPQITGSTSPLYQFSGGGAINSNVGIAALQDWGLNAAANAQAALLREGQANNVMAAREQEISRGMGRSGVAQGVEANVYRLGDLDIQKVLADAAAEQGRLNQQVAINNSNNALGREQSNQSAGLQSDTIRSGYDQFLRSLALDTQTADAGNRLAYLGYDQGRSEFGQQQALAELTQSQNNALGQQSLAAENARAAATNATNVYGIDAQSASARANNAAPSAAQMATQPFTVQAAHNFQTDRMDIISKVALTASEQGGLSFADILQTIADVKAQYPGVDPTQDAEFMKYLMGLQAPNAGV